MSVVKRLLLGTIAASALFFAACVPPTPTPTPTSTPTPTPGPFTEQQLIEQKCDLSRPAIYYRASSDHYSVPAQAPAGTKAPVPCMTLTGIGSTEPAIAVARDNTVFFAPAFTADGIGVLRSKDYGVNWDVVIPTLPRRAKHTRYLPYLWMDPDTDRLIFLSSGGFGSYVADKHYNLSITTDKGASWSFVEAANEAGHATMDWGKLYSGPPVTSKTKGTPNVIYLSGPNPISVPIPVVRNAQVMTPKNQVFYRSLDGGATWTYVSSLNLDPKDEPSCNDPNEYIIFGSGTVGPDGTVYVIYRRCTQLSIAVSKDEAKTWQVVDVTGAQLPPYNTRRMHQIVANPNILVTELITTDSQGNVYVIWADPDDSLRYSYSRDKGKTWSPHVAVAAPDVINVRYGNIAVKTPGTIAIGYYGSTDGVAYHGYIAETTNAFDPEPRFWSVTVDSPADPLYRWGFEVGYMGVIYGEGDMNEILQVKYAPNGDLWASFVKDMCEAAMDERCYWDTEAHAGSVFQAVVGRAVHNVSNTWDVAKVANPPPPYDCTQGDPAKNAACYEIAIGEEICPEIYECACDNCHCLMLECREDPHCDELRQCATRTGCRGWDCLLTCGRDVVLGGSELSCSAALGVADCTLDNGCNRFCAGGE